MPASRPVPQAADAEDEIEPMSLHFRPAPRRTGRSSGRSCGRSCRPADTYTYDPAMDAQAGRGPGWPGRRTRPGWSATTRHGARQLQDRPEPGRPGCARGDRVLHRRGSSARPGHRPGDGRAFSLDQARAGGFRGIQFNAVAASNVYAVKLYEDLGFDIVGAVPGGFRPSAAGLRGPADHVPRPTGDVAPRLSAIDRQHPADRRVGRIGLRGAGGRAAVRAGRHRRRRPSRPGASWPRSGRPAP